MRLLRETRGFTDFPVDLTSKVGQKAVKTAIQESVVEMIEALGELRNAKDHRATDIPEINDDAFLEEMCDALHYMIEALILAGVPRERLVAAYLAKGEKNTTRILGGY